MNDIRDERLQVMLSPEELAALDDFRFKHCMPTRAAAVRELLKLGLAGIGENGGAGEQLWGVQAWPGWTHARRPGFRRGLA
jgi:hypothetical protein